MTTTVPSLLSDEQTRALADVLRAQADERRAQLAALEAGDGDLEVVVAQRGVARRTLREIEAALARVDNGSYGLCTRCGGPIPYPRLELVPHTPGCTGCLSRFPDRW